MNDNGAAFVIGMMLGSLVSTGSGLALRAWTSADYWMSARPICAQRAAYPVGNSGPLVICEGVDANGGRVLTVVEVK